jgi:hypothetical protein
MERKVLALLSCLPLGAVACYDAPYVVVDVTGPQLPSLAQFNATVSDASHSETIAIPSLPQPTPIALPVSLTLQLPSNERGLVKVRMDAFDASAILLASGQQSVEITGPGRYDLNVPLGETSVDMAGPGCPCEFLSTTDVQTGLYCGSVVETVQTMYSCWVPRLAQHPSDLWQCVGTASAPGSWTLAEVCAQGCKVNSNTNPDNCL